MAILACDDAGFVELAAADPSDSDESGETSDLAPVQRLDAGTSEAARTITADELALLRELPQDPPPSFLDGMTKFDRHFYSSDEWNLHLFEPHLRRPEGDERAWAMLAIGSEQGYMMAGWADPTIMWIVDYDPEIVVIHRALDELILACEDPAEFARLFDEPNAKPAGAILSASADERVRTQSRPAFMRAFGRLRHRFTILRERTAAGAISTWLDDPIQYDRVRNLIRDGRLLHGRIDLNGDAGMLGIADALTQIEVPLRVLYLSNAEQYWNYEPQFRTNIRALPFSEDAIVLRTLSALKRNGDYRYNIHEASDFVTQLGESKVRRVYQVVDLPPIKHRQDIPLIVTKAQPSESPEAPVPDEPALIAAVVAQPEPEPEPVVEAVPEPEPQPEPELEPPPPAPMPPPPSEPVLASAPPGRALEVEPCASAPAGMVCIPGGSFIRGIDEGSAYAKPAMDVWLQTYYIDATEVTYAAYVACMDRGECPDAKPLYGGFREDDMPMNGVDWSDSDAYCRAVGKSLPTEAQWEKAARGTDGRIYPWGDEDASCDLAILHDRREGRGCGRAGWGKDAEVGRPWAVASRPPNPYGVYDMAGNAYEWVADWFAVDYAHCGEACEGPDPLGPCAGAAECPGHSKKVVRGGSWYWPGYHATTFHRRAHVPDNEPFHHFGFRCAASVEQAAELRNE